MELITRMYHEIKLRIGGYFYQMKEVTYRFLKSQKISYDFNKEIAQDYRYYESVGINVANYGNGKHELHLMDRAQLTTSLGHCYSTLQHVHDKYIDVFTKYTQLRDEIEFANPELLKEFDFVRDPANNNWNESV